MLKGLNKLIFNDASLMKIIESYINEKLFNGVEIRVASIERKEPSHQGAETTVTFESKTENSGS